MAKRTIHTHMENNYKAEDFIIEDLFYNFKDGYYHAEIISPSSIDTHFTISASSKEISYDGYEDEVLSGWNTYLRIDEEYRALVEEVFSSPDFPLVSDIDFGSIPLLDENAYNDYTEPNYGVALDELEIDEEYDVKKLGKTKGHITFYAQDEEISFDRASELLFMLKNILDEAAVPFYGIDFTLEKPRTAEGIVNEDDTTIHVAHFLYEDIAQEGLVNRIERAHDALTEFYAEEDAS